MAFFANVVVSLASGAIDIDIIASAGRPSARLTHLGDGASHTLHTKNAETRNSNAKPCHPAFNSATLLFSHFLTHSSTMTMTAFVPSGRGVATSRGLGGHSANTRRPLHIPQQQSLHALNAFSPALISSTTAIASTDAAADVRVFEPVMPDTSGLAAMGGVVVICVVAALVWNNSVVPISRTKLAISKSRGEVKQYLDELEEGAAAPTPTTSASSLADGEESAATANSMQTSEEPVKSDGREFERWLFTDWLEGRKSGSKAGRQKEPAIPILKSAKWNSGDNPVVVTSALMFLGVIVASLTERVGSMM